MNQQSWRPFLMVSLVLCIGTIGTALASPLYPIYQQLWHLVPSQITYIFVAYMFGCLATLLFLGRMSNSLGFLRTLQMGMLCILIGLIISLFANNALALSIGRFIIGIASGLITTSALIGLVHTIPQRHKLQAPQYSSIITAIGFGLGPFVGGFIAQFSERPLFTPYIPIIVGSIIGFFGLFLLKKPDFTPQKFSFSPKLQLPENQFKTPFMIIALTAFSNFAAFSLFASLSPSFVKQILPWHGPFVSGASISAILLISVIVQFVSKSKNISTCLTYGIAGILLSLVLLAICMGFGLSFLFIFSIIILGIGHGLAFIGSFGILHRSTNESNRAAVMSTFLFIAYLGTIIPIIAVGYLSDFLGFKVSVILFCLAIGSLCLSQLYGYRKFIRKVA